MFCSKCGTNLVGGDFCQNCGAKAAPATPATPTAAQPPQPAPQPTAQNAGIQGSNTQYTPPPSQPYAMPGSFAERLHSYGGSTLFLIGIILLTVGILVSNIITFNIIPLILAALPLTALWLIFAASKSPKSPGSTLAALTLTKVYAIIGLVLFSLVTLLLLIVGIALAIFAAADGGAGIAAIVGIVFLVVMVIMILYIIFYYSALLRLLSGIRNGIKTNVFTPIRGVTAFSVITFITVGFGILGSIVMIAMSGFMNDLIMDAMWYMDPWMQDIYRPLMGMFAPGMMVISGLFTLVTYVGTIICVVVLNKFNGSLKRGQQN
ncbi:MAG: hypothetical protein FWE04_07380 [Oscillospiraceae bacterium]|nr:hypothetical protein [Oscillospiraceae bacterium]